MTLLALLASATAGALLAGPPGSAARLRRLLPPEPRPRRSGPTRLPDLLAAVVAALAWLVVGGMAGLVVAAPAFVGARRALARLLGADDSAVRGRVRADLPVALELLAVCLQAGAVVGRALLLVAEGTGGPVGAALSAVAAARSLGTDPVEAWAPLADLPGADEEVRTAVGLLARSDVGGASPAAAVAELAQVQRERAQADALDRARRTAVLAVLPLGLCFLPAFVLVGVVPLVGGLVTRLLG